MSTEDDKWNIDRLPTKWERMYGSVFSVLIFVLMTVFLYASSLTLVSSEEITTNILVTFVVSALLFSGSGYLVLRVVFSKRRKPSARAIIITGYVIGVASCILLVLSILGFGNTPYLAGVGFAGLAGSSLIISKGKRRGNS
jgi:hypothetical protein